VSSRRSLLPDRRKANRVPAVPCLVKLRRAAPVGLTCLLLLALAGRTSAAIRVLKSEQELEAPVFGPLSTNTSRHRIACGQDACLLVWNDSREGGGVWGQRVRADGTPLDKSSFLIGSGSDPTVVSDGDGFLVATGSRFTGQVMRMGSSGEVTIVQTSELVQYPEGAFEDLHLAAGPDGFLLAWAPGSDGGGRVFAQRLDSAGRFAGPRLVLAGPGARDFADVAWTGQQYLVVWREARDGKIFVAAGARVKADGTLLDPGGFDVAPLGAWSNEPRLISNGKEALLLAGAVPGRSTSDVDMMLLDGDGKNGRRLNLPWVDRVSLPYSPAATWDGTQFIVTWLQGSRVAATRIRTDGTILDALPIAVGTVRGISAPREPAVASIASQSMIVFSQSNSPYGLKRTTIRGDGTIVSPVGAPIATSGNAQRFLAGAHTMGTTLAVFSDERDGPETAQLRALRIDSAGTVVGPALVLGSGVTRKGALVIGAKDTFAVVWWQTNGTTNSLRAARVKVTGQVLETSPKEIMLDLAPLGDLLLAGTGSGYLVMWQSWPFNADGPVTFARRLDLDLNPLGPDLQLGGPRASGPMALLAVDDGYLALWNQSPVWGARTVRIAADGSLSPSTDGTLLRDAPTPLSFWLASNDKIILLSCNLSSALLNRSGPIEVTPWIETASVSAAPTWDGHLFTSSRFTGYSSGDLAVRQIASDGTLANEQVLPLSITQATPPTMIGIGQGRNLVFYGRQVPTPVNGNTSVRFMLVGPDSETSDGGFPGPDGGFKADAGISVEPDGAPDLPHGPPPEQRADGPVVSRDATSDSIPSPMPPASFDAGPTPAEPSSDTGHESGPWAVPEIDATPGMSEVGGAAPASLGMSELADAEVPATQTPGAAPADGHAGAGIGQNGHDLSSSDHSSGCQCQLKGGPEGNATGWFVAALLGATLRRRRRR
jgi:MYXO-CTERM domain-containing protein